MRQQSYAAADNLSPETVAVVHREALLTLRPALSSAEIDPVIEAPDEGAVARWREVAERQGRWPQKRWRVFNRTGVDLDPTRDDHFQLMLTLSPHALLLQAFDHDGGEILTATDEGGLYVILTPAQYQDLGDRIPVGVLRAV